MNGNYIAIRHEPIISKTYNSAQHQGAFTFLNKDGKSSSIVTKSSSFLDFDNGIISKDHFVFSDFLTRSGAIEYVHVFKLTQMSSDAIQETGIALHPRLAPSLDLGEIVIFFDSDTATVFTPKTQKALQKISGIVQSSYKQSAVIADQQVILARQTRKLGFNRLVLESYDFSGRRNWTSEPILNYFTAKREACRPYSIQQMQLDSTKTSLLISVNHGSGRDAGLYRFALNNGHLLEKLTGFSFINVFAELDSHHFAIVGRPSTFVNFSYANSSRLYWVEMSNGEGKFNPISGFDQTLTDAKVLYSGENNGKHFLTGMGNSIAGYQKPFTLVVSLVSDQLEVKKWDQLVGPLVNDVQLEKGHEILTYLDFSPEDKMWIVYLYCPKTGKSVEVERISNDFTYPKLLELKDYIGIQTSYRPSFYSKTDICESSQEKINPKVTLDYPASISKTVFPMDHNSIMLFTGQSMKRINIDLNPENP